MKQPETILFTLLGISPAVLTETVWAMAESQPAILPDRIIVLTTTRGAAAAKEQLLECQPGFSAPVWDQLRVALEQRGHPVEGKLKFGGTGDHLRIFTRHDPASGRSMELDDIRSARENEDVADFILEHLRGLVENSETRVIASLAGGRKTMGALLYACMTLLGRDHDRLTHVLVDAPYDDPRLTPRFYFPGQTPQHLRDPEGVEVEAAQAVIHMAETPFVPLRNLFRRDLGRMPGGFMNLVRHCREEARSNPERQATLILEEKRRRLQVGDHPLTPSPREQVLLLLLFRRALAGDSPFGAHVEALEPLNELRTELRQQAEGMSDWRYEVGSEISEDDLRRALSGLRRKLQACGPDGVAVRDALPTRGRFSLDWPVEKLRCEP